MTLKRFLTFAEARELLNTTNGHLRSMVFKGQIPYIKLNRLIRFDYDDLVKWLDSNKKTPNAGFERGRNESSL